MPEEEIEKLSLLGCGKYWNRHRKEAWEKKDGFYPMIAAILGAVGWITASFGLKTPESWIPTTGAWASACLVIWAVLYSIFWLPYKYTHERVGKHRESLAAKDEEIEAMKEEVAPKLEISGVESEVSESPHTVRIKVTNKGGKTADALRVELIDPPGGWGKWKKRQGPKQLHPFLRIQRGGQFVSMSNLVTALTPLPILDQSLNSGQSLEFDLLMAHRKGTLRDDGGYSVFFQMSTASDAMSEFTEALFHKMEQPYRLRLRATAKDLPATEAEFDILFSGERSACRFTLTEVKK